MTSICYGGFELLLTAHGNRGFCRGELDRRFLYCNRTFRLAAKTTVSAAVCEISGDDRPAGFLAVTFPVLLTEATEGLLEVHFTFRLLEQRCLEREEDKDRVFLLYRFRETEDFFSLR